MLNATYHGIVQTQTAEDYALPAHVCLKLRQIAQYTVLMQANQQLLH